MNLQSAIYRAAQNAGKDGSKIGWNLDSGMSAQGAYTVADLASAVDYHPSLAGWTLTAGDVTAAWSLILRDQYNAINAGDDAGVFTLTADKTTITANDVDAATVTVAPASGEYHWSLWLEGDMVASSATLGVIDLADGYALAVTADGAGEYVLRVIQGGTYKQITITAVE